MPPIPTHTPPAVPAAPPARAARCPLMLATAAGVAALVAAALAHPGDASSGPVDRRLRRALRPRGQGGVPQTARSSGRHGAVSTAVGGLSGEGATLAAGALAAAAVGWRRGRRPAVPVLAAVPGALAAHAAIKYSVRRERPRAAALTGKHTPSFPSGHAARGAAAAGIVGYLAVREAGARLGVALPLGLAVAAAGGSARVYSERHWVSDAVGGWGLGVAAAALAALWYEREREAR